MNLRLRDHGRSDRLTQEVRAVVLGLLALLGGSALPGQAPVITLACEDKVDFPHVLGDGDAVDWKRPGASLEFIKLLTEELGLKVVIKRLPWKRALELELRSGAIDGLFPASYRTEREVFGAYPKKDGKEDESRSMFVSSYCFYKLRTSPLEWDGRRLRNLTGAIGASRGYSVVSELKQMGYKVEESDDGRKDLRRLSQGWLAAVAALEPAEDHLLESMPELGSTIVKVQPPISRKHFYLMLSHGFVARNPELAQRIWNATKELRERDMPRILNKYLGK